MTGFLSRNETPKAAPSSTGPREVTQAYADTALRNAVREMYETTEGGRNDKLNILAYNLRPFIVAGILDELYVSDELGKAASMSGLTDVEIRKTIQSGFDGADAESGVSYVLEASPVSSPMTMPEIVSLVDPVAGNDVWGDLPPVDGADWMFAADDKQTILWGDGDEILWAEGEALMIAGGMGLGKTTLAGMLLRGLLGLEDSVLDLPVHKADKPILYLAMDRPRQIRRSFKRQFKEIDREALRGRLIVRPGPPMIDLAVCPPLLAKMATEVGAGTVFVDSLKDAVVGLSEDATAAAYNRARQALLAKGINICELHHSRKASKESTGGIEEVFGSTWITAGAGSVIILSGQPGDPLVKFRHAKQPADEVGPFTLAHNAVVGELEVQHVKLYDLFESAGVDGVTAKTAASRLYDAYEPSEAQNKKASRYLDKLVKKGQLTKIDGHRGGPRGSVPTCWFLAPRTDEFVP